MKIKEKLKKLIPEKNENSSIDEHIESIRTEMEKYDPGSKEWNALNSNLPDYYKVQIEAKDVKTRKVLKKIEVGGSLILSVLGFGLYKRYLDKGFEFEKEGTFTSSTFRNLIGKIRPGK